MIDVHVTNSLTGKKELLKTSAPGKVKMYSCGPTVYDFIHVGNLRAAMTSDLFFRTLKKMGYDVTYVRNYTDVDDRIIAKANKEGVSSDVITKRYISEVERDYAAAGLLEPTHKTTVTGHMTEIVEMIEKIISNKHGYVNADKEVFFDIDSFKDYGKLSKKNLEELQAGARVEVNEKKKNPADFSLWKPAKPGEPFWESPWGKGRPGWHIECSAMACKWLGEEMDIHHGGSDLIFPHHENEIAQSEAATKHKPYVRYWLHNAMLNINAEKMSKSLGNFITARDFLTKFGGEVTRMMFMSVHYRSIADFTEETISTAMSSLQRLYEAKQKAMNMMQIKAALADQRAESLWADFVADCELTRKEIVTHMANDFNTQGALASVFTLIRKFNKVLGEPRAEATPAAVLGAQELLRLIEEDLGGYTGIGRISPQSVFNKLNEINQAQAQSKSGGTLTPAEIESMIQKRIEARKNKNFAESDRIRNELESKGVAIKDGPQGTTWQYVNK